MVVRCGRSAGGLKEAVAVVSTNGGLALVPNRMEKVSASPSGSLLLQRKFGNCVRTKALPSGRNRLLGGRWRRVGADNGQRLRERCRRQPGDIAGGGANHQARRGSVRHLQRVTAHVAHGERTKPTLPWVQVTK